MEHVTLRESHHGTTRLQPISRAFHSEKYEIAYFWCETDHMFFKTRFEQEILVVKYANSTIATL